VSLFWRVALLNAAVLFAALVALAVTPATVSARATAEELGVLTAGALALLAINVFALRRAFAPLNELTALMRRVDPQQPGRRIAVDRTTAEVAALEGAFNEMLDRLEDERRTSSRRALDAQERERRRLADHVEPGGLGRGGDIVRRRPCSVGVHQARDGNACPRTGSRAPTDAARPA